VSRTARGNGNFRHPLGYGITMARLARRFGKTLAALMPLLWIGCQAAEPGIVPEIVPPTRELALSANDRVLILAPHPDDEVLGSGGVIQKAKALGVPVHVVFLTCGESNLWAYAVYRHALPRTPAQVRRMGLVRRAEALAADASLGMPPQELAFLGYPDQGTLAIWTSHWGDGEPYRSPLLGATAVPYAVAYRPGAAYKGESIVADLMDILRRFRPTKIVVSHPADDHPDHQALYLFTRVALWNLQGELSPQLYPVLIHHAGWPQPAGYDPTAALAPPPALANAPGWLEMPLPARAVAAKLAALEKHRSQYTSDGVFLRQLVRANELFGDLPTVTLAPEGTAVLAVPGDGMLPPAVPADLTRIEEKLLAELREVALRREGGELVVTAAFSRPFQRETRLSLALFGYRPDRPFGAMPKLRVRLDAQSQAVYDQARQLPPASVTVARESTTAVVRIPLDLLGDPERLLVDARSWAGPVPLDRTPWRAVALR
jgi:LmbE family N-acetylglucosaminyl deacetylase